MDMPKELLARGRTADVFAWQPGKVLKLYHPKFSRGMAEYEQRMAQIVHSAGVFTPAVGEIVQQDERWGLVYERVDATTMFRGLLSRPWTAKRLARQMAELHAAMHACAAPTLPPMHLRLIEKLREARPLPEDLRQAALGALEKLPQAQMVCHGDFHPENILMTNRGPMVIDWIDATAGHPMGDVARTKLLTLHGALPPGNPLAILITWMRRTFYQAYEERYFSLSPYSADEVAAWIPVIAAARLSEGINEEEQNLLRMAKTGLQAG
jgi:uncharacterized protein (TIGR02172 family)